MVVRDGYEVREGHIVSNERSLGELFSELSRETSTLFQKEVQLAKVEMSRKAAQAGKDAGFLVAGGAIAYAGFLTLLAAAVLGLAQVMPDWLAAVIVGVVIAGIGYALVQKGMSDLRKINPAPRRTLETLKEDKEWLKQQVR
jgi:xanthine/uracil permease